MDAILRRDRHHAKERELTGQAQDCLPTSGRRAFRASRPGTCCPASSQGWEIARGLVAGPRPGERLNQVGGTLSGGEQQNALMALSVAHRAYVLETGRIVLEGTAKELKESPRVREAYLGIH